MSVTVFNPRIDDDAVAETTVTARAVTALKEASSAQAPVEKSSDKKGLCHDTRLSDECL